MPPATSGGVLHGAILDSPSTFKAQPPLRPIVDGELQAPFHDLVEMLNDLNEGQRPSHFQHSIATSSHLDGELQHFVLDVHAQRIAARVVEQQTAEDQHRGGCK